MDQLESAFSDCQRGVVSREPMIEMTIPSSLDDSLAPDGHHVCLFFTQYSPPNKVRDKTIIFKTSGEAQPYVGGTKN